MERDNVTSVQTFILLGFSHLPHLRLFLVSVFSLLYIFTLLGNGLIIILIKTDHRLHTPMYFFLANFSLMDLFYPSVTVPKMIWDLVFREGVISFHGCIAQLFFFITFASNECLFLSVMAFDRYLAICKPLHYGTIMSHRMCLKLTGGAWVTGFLYSVIHTVLTNSMLFCGPNLINHFFCEIPPLFQLACSDITFNMTCVFVSAFVMGVCNFSITLGSYTGIVSIILRIKSTEGRMKAFSTCVSHLMVVSMYYGTLLITYFRPMSSYSQSRDRTAAVIYTTVTPVLNPVIYSLRNKDVKKALKKILWKGAIS